MEDRLLPGRPDFVRLRRDKIALTYSKAEKEDPCSVGDLGLTPGLGRSPGDGKGYPLQYSGLENSMECPWGCKESDTTELLSLHLIEKKQQKSDPST